MLRFCSFLFIFFAFKAYPQEPVRKGLFSVTGGFTYCNLNESNFSTDYIWDFYLGLRKDIELSKSTFLNTGVLYAGLGAKINREFSGDDLKIQTIQFPVGIKQYILRSLYFTAGGSANLRLGARVNRDAIPGETKFFDVAVSLGAGYNINRVSIDARWNYGLLNIRRNDGRISGNNQYFLVGLGYRFSS